MEVLNNIFDFISANIEFFHVTAYILLGGCILYYRGNVKLQSAVAGLITEAEQSFNSVKCGGQKFAWVVGKLYDLIPTALKTIITKQMVERIVQGTFDSMARYAKSQMDKIVDKALEDKKEE